MSLTMNESYAHRALLFVASATATLSKLSITCTPSAALKYVQGTTVLTERAAIAKALSSSVAGFTGKSATSQALVQQWLNWADTHVTPVAGDIAAVERQLAAANYMAGTSITVADLMVYYTLNPLLHTLTAQQKASFPALFRWVDQLLHEPGFAVSGIAGAPEAPAVAPRAPLRLFAVAAPSTAASGAGESKKPAGAPAATAAADAPKAADKPAGEPSGKKDKVKTEPKKEEAAAGAGKSGRNKEKPAAPEVDPVALVDLRVGKIVKVWEHPDAARLFCEEIDVGEGALRRIASGLREHYTLAQMENRSVIVVCNLKPRALQGFESNGMVLAATSSDGKVELLAPPEGAKAGERVSFAGHSAPPAEPNQMAKKKYFDTVAESLRVGDDLVANYKGIPFMTSAGPITVPTVKGASIH